MAPRSPLTIPPGSDYTVVKKPRPWVVAVIHGETGQGKTTLVTDSCPEPVHLINFDGRAEPAVERALSRGRTVLLAHIPCPVGSAKVEAAKAKEISRTALDRIQRNLEISLREAEKGNVRTIGLDTGTELSEIIALSITGQFEPVKGDYGQSKGALNLIWRKMLMDARKVPVHLVILARSREVWANQKPTGHFIPRGPDVMEEGADFVAQMRMKSRKGRDGTEVKFELVMTNPKLDVSQMGEVYTEEDWGELGPFRYACMLQGVELE